MQKRDLPIYAIEKTLLESLTLNKRLVLTAPTGSGKSTQVPQVLLDGGLLGEGQVMILQPRRLATRMLAGWVARARSVKLGAEVGYQMRLANITSPATRICYLTEGVLLRRMMSDPGLAGISAIIFDEFHERHLYGDITLARALEIQQSSRPDLMILVMSATLDVMMVRNYLEPCTVLISQGRTYPVNIEYLSRPAGNQPIWDAALKELPRLLREHPEGDVLVFMPGVYEILRTVQGARDSLGPRFIVLPLHGELPSQDQDAAVACYDRRKIVVATNVAETSVTIDGVRLVIDSGLARIQRYDPYRGINTLLVEKISRAAADQRAGRAGRTAPGHCLRLWTSHEHSGRPSLEPPEVKRLDLAEAILALKANGVSNVKTFRWIEAPDERSLDRAATLLRDLGALDPTSGAITELGRRMLAFPVHPRYARMLLAARDYGCVRPVALIAALTQGRDLVLRRHGRSPEDPPAEWFGGNTESDFFVLARAWRYAERHGYDADFCRRVGIHNHAARHVAALFEQFLRIAAAEGLDTSDQPDAPDAVQRCVLLGFSDQVAKRVEPSGLRCQLIHGRRGLLSRESVVKAPLLVASEVREVESGSSRNRTLNVMLNLATAIKEEWLRDVFPDDFTSVHAVVYDPALRRVNVRSEKRFRDLLLEEMISAEPPPTAEAAAILAREVAAGRCLLANWDEAVEQWILRVNRLRQWIPELALPPIGAEERSAIIELICQGACSYNEIKDRPVLPIVKSWLSREQQKWVEDLAPERILLPCGRKAKIVYADEGAPMLAARIQDLYGIREALWIANHRVAVRIQVLAPSNRPVQITDNLSVFWRDTYPKIKHQLQRRYPKHEWR